MKAPFLIIILAAVILAASCDDNGGQPPIIPNQQDSIEVITDTVKLFPKIVKCIMRYDEDEYVINDDLTYQKLLKNKMPFQECESYTLPVIDFTKRTLIGKYTLACAYPRPDYNSSLIRNNIIKKYYYQIYISYREGTPQFINMNWLSIPKIPEGYTVEFSTSYTIID